MTASLTSGFDAETSNRQQRVKETLSTMLTTFTVSTLRTFSEKAQVHLLEGLSNSLRARHAAAEEISPEPFMRTAWEHCFFSKNAEDIRSIEAMITERRAALATKAGIAPAPP